MRTNASERILLVDDDRSLLEGIVRTHRKHLDIRTACGGLEGLKLLETEGPFSVVVSDFNMPQMDGAQFLARVRTLSPDSVRVMLTGNADLQTAIGAVNQGAIFRFVTKPCDADEFRAVMAAALEMNRLRQAEKQLLEQTLAGSIRALAELLALAKPQAFGRSARLERYARQVAVALGFKSTWEFETAALLSQIGLVAVPEGILTKAAAGATLDPEEEAIVATHPGIARRLLHKIPRLELVAEMIAHQRRRFDGGGGAGPTGAQIPIGGRILAVVLAFDELTSRGLSAEAARSTMQKAEGAFDPAILAVLPEVEPATLETIVGPSSDVEHRSQEVASRCFIS
jgi:response regulator RpfG family c-di-GMP phosphodiesterase